MATLQHLPGRPSLDWRELAASDSIECQAGGCHQRAGYCRTYRNHSMPASSFEYLCDTHAAMLMNADIVSYYTQELEQAAQDMEEKEAGNE